LPISRECGSVISNEQIVAAERNFQATLIPLYANIAASSPIKVYWHVIMADGTAAGGNIPYVLCLSVFTSLIDL
jgi:hypothetical protein